MHIVRQQRLAAGRMLSGDDPVVGAGRATVAGGQAQQLAQFFRRGAGRVPHSRRVFVFAARVGYLEAQPVVPTGL